LRYLDHGWGVHKALELIWRELRSHARLLEMKEDDLQRLVVRSVSAAMAGLPAAVGRTVEQRRLERLLMEWLAIEKKRDPFVVREPEQERLARVGSLQIKIRGDRVDQLPDGRVVILDYKTGAPKADVWDTDRPDEPQIPLYCATSELPAAGAALVAIRTGELGFRGLLESGVSMPAFKEMKMFETVPFGQQIQRWKQAIEHLAENYQAGRAEVDPKEKAACEHCSLWALCRIRESENGRG